MTKPSRNQILTLYRHIIRNAKVFPSIKRHKILKEIQLEFRENRTMTDEKELNLSYQKAAKGLGQLQMYTNLNSSSPEWVVNLEKEPMPRKGIS